MTDIHILNKNDMKYYLHAHVNLDTNNIFIDGFSIEHNKKLFNNNIIDIIVHIINHEYLHIAIKEITHSNLSSIKLDNYIYNKTDFYNNDDIIKELQECFLW